MNSEHFELIKMIEAADSNKAKFLRHLLMRAATGYDLAVKEDAQRLGGELSLSIATESQGTYYGKKNVGLFYHTGGELHTSIGHKFRDAKTVDDFDWSKYGPESLYRE